MLNFIEQQGERKLAMRHFKKNMLVLGAGLAMVQSAAADWAPSKAEMATLPAYCAARFDERSAAFQTWKSTMGGDFIHVHHYCAGLNFVNRARGMASAKDRRGVLGAAVRNFDYILTHTQPDFYLRAEALMNRGIAMSMMQKPGEAVGNLHQAIEMNPRLPRAYMTLADLYDRQKNRSKALETVTAGLRHNPDAKSLQRRYTELGGKLPYPVPVEPASAEAAAAKPDEPATPAPAAEPAAAAPVAETPAVPAAEPAAAPKIGSPTNPYCRFCPD